jgi:hypothetical protein
MVQVVGGSTARGGEGTTTMLELQESLRCGTVTWRSTEVAVGVRFSGLLPEPTGRLECDQQFPVGTGLPLRLHDQRGTLVVIVGPCNQFMGVRPLE